MEESARLESLRALQILDTPPEPAFDDIARLAAALCGVPTALVTLVDANRQWFKARVGLALAETPREHSFCAHAVEAGTTMVVSDARADPRFLANPLVTGEPFIRFYAGVPLVGEDGAPVGTLCVMDRVARELSEPQREALTILARQAADELTDRHARGRSLGAEPAMIDGLVAGRYRIESILGRGGMGVVAAARDTRDDEDVAIKFLLPSAAADDDARERFVREARALLALRSEHVTRVLDVGNLANGAPFIVMERLHGIDLWKRLQKGGRLPVREAVALVRQACAGLAAAHDAGILHRDLKPANLFLVEHADGPPSLKLLDFGVARSTATDGASSHLTDASNWVGTAAYVSPEQFADPGTIDVRADVWSMGVVLYELIAGRLPFEGGGSPMSVLARQMREPPPPLDRDRADVPAGLAAVVASCLKLPRGERPASARALSAALEPYERAVLPSPRSQVPRNAAWVLVVAALALALAAAWVMMR